MSSSNMGYAKDGDVTFLYSYNTVIGIVDKYGNTVLTDKRYSVTTSCHHSAFRSMFNAQTVSESLFRKLSDAYGRKGAIRYVPNCKWTRQTIGLPVIKEVKKRAEPVTTW